MRFVTTGICGIFFLVSYFFQKTHLCTTSVLRTFFVSLCTIGVNLDTYFVILSKGRGPKKIDFFLGKSPKLWVGGGQES